MIAFILFWGAVAFVVYIYLIFPGLVFLQGLFAQHLFKRGDITPQVSILIAAHNEIANIEGRIRNLLALDYPKDRLEVIIASDGSDDGTNEAIRRYESQGIRLLALPRQGKIKALNAAAETAQGEILVFSDANTVYAPDALRALVRPFSDPEVGGVAGNQYYLQKHGSDGISAGEHSYWNFDRQMKNYQSRAGNVISATGSIYAVRRSLFKPIPGGVTDDFVVSTRVIAQGYRLVFASDALAYEPAAESREVEFGRKVRITTQGLRAVLVMRELLNPFRFGFYAIQLFSHKVLRRLAFFPLLVLFGVTPFLWNRGLLYQVAELGQVIIYFCAALGIVLRHTKIGQVKVFTLPLFFCMIYAASLLATINVLRDRQIELWVPQRHIEDQNRQEAGASWTAPTEQRTS